MATSKIENLGGQIATLNSNLATSEVSYTATDALTVAGSITGKKTGNVVQITGINVRLASSISADTHIATLSKNPSTQTFGTGVTVSGDFFLVFVRTDGKLMMSGINAPPANTNLYFTLTYII